MKLQPVKLDVELVWKGIAESLHIDPVTTHRLGRERAGALDSGSMRLARRAIGMGCPIYYDRTMRRGQVVLFKDPWTDTPRLHVHPDTDLKFWLDLANLNRRLDRLAERMQP